MSFRAKLFWLSVNVSQFCPPVFVCVDVCFSSCLIQLFSALLVFQDVCGGVPASLTTVCFSSVRKRIPQQPRSHQKGAAHKPPSTIFGFSPKHAHSYHLCADLKWTLRTLLVSKPQ